MGLKGAEGGDLGPFPILDITTSARLVQVSDCGLTTCVEVSYNIMNLMDLVPRFNVSGVMW
jgi:hypothetical protein